MASYITDGKLYIRMRQNKAETCTLSKAQIFDDEKAENILKYMPRTLQKFHFRVKRIHNNEGRITCGNAILSGSLPECNYSETVYKI